MPLAFAASVLFAPSVSAQRAETPEIFLAQLKQVIYAVYPLNIRQTLVWFACTDVAAQDMWTEGKPGRLNMSNREFRRGVAEIGSPRYAYGGVYVVDIKLCIGSMPQEHLASGGYAYSFEIVDLNGSDFCIAAVSGIG